MIDEDDHNYGSDEDGYDAAPLLTKNYGACANASRLRPVHHQKFHCVLVQNRRVDLYAIDVPRPTHWLIYAQVAPRPAVVETPAELRAAPPLLLPGLRLRPFAPRRRRAGRDISNRTVPRQTKVAAARV